MRLLVTPGSVAAGLHFIAVILSKPLIKVMCMDVYVFEESARKKTGGSIVYNEKFFPHHDWPYLPMREMPISCQLLDRFFSFGAELRGFRLLEWALTLVCGHHLKSHYLY